MSMPELAAWYADAAAASCLEVLTEEGLNTDDLLDAATLSAVASAADAQPKFKRARPEPHEAARESSPGKFENWDDSGDEIDATASEDKTTSKKSGKPSQNAAARTKACREKARRERINERFLELATLLERGKEPKIDKSSILGDAIKAFQQLLAENNQLRQLNKFLEERVGQLEKAQGQQLYQHAMYQTQAAQMMQPRNHGGASSSCMHQVVTGVPCLQPNSMSNSMSNSMTNTLPNNPVGHSGHTCDLPHNLLQQQLVLQDRHPGSLTTAMSASLNPAMSGSLPSSMQPAMSCNNAPQGSIAVPANMLQGKVALLNSLLSGQNTDLSAHLPYMMAAGTTLDHWQDSLLRPPAA